MLQFPGAPALSSFRIAKLLDRLRALEPSVSGLDARYTHFVDVAQPLTAGERTVLGQLLTYGPRLPAALDEGGEGVLVVPRIGTISPSHTPASGSGRRRPRGFCFCDGNRGSPSSRYAVAVENHAFAAATAGAWV